MANINLDDLKGLAIIAQRNGTTDAFISLALQWAEQADKEIDRLQNENRIMKITLGFNQGSGDCA